MAHRDLTFNGPTNGSTDGENRSDRSDRPDERVSNDTVSENPFVSPLEDELSVESNNSSLRQLEDFQHMQQYSSQDQDQDHDQEGQYGNRQYGGGLNFSGLQSRNGTDTHLLSHENSSDDVSNYLVPLNNMGMASAGSQNIHVPPEYDRYPSMAGSRVVSSTSLTSHFNNLQFYDRSLPGDEAEESLMSGKSANPFLSSTDFSPFGGYPSSSFPLHIDEKEPDDYLHNPDPIADAAYDKNRFLYDLKHMDRRSFGGLLGVIFLFVAVVVIFVLLPVLFYSGATSPYHPETYTVLTKYLYPILSAIRTDLVDPDTPSSALTRENSKGETWKLVFSDEFDAEGRTFYDGDDQFFQGVDINYASTKDLEWYDPDAASTANGTLNLRMDAYKNHDLFYRSAMVQSWNKMCFTQGLLEISARLPNYGNKLGLWPGLWSMGNLGRPGYMASTEGVWPYTYNSCDAGITPNQSSPDGISYLPGQKLNKCTCSGEDHPNRGTGRGAPEIDAIEGTVQDISSGERCGVASQSMQVAPYDIWYMPNYDFIEIHNELITSMNTYTGGPIQQAISAASTLNTTWYEYGSGAHNFQRYGFEYINDEDDGYCTWYVGTEPTMTVHSYALAPNGNVGWRYISKEPMSIVMNLGISNNWVYIDWPTINFPVTLRVDYVRIYQPEDLINLTCDPDDYPTVDYIEDHEKAYYNVNYTTWEEAGYSFPKHKLTSNC